MIVRELPPAEWGRLDGTTLTRVYPLMDRSTERIMVAEVDHHIVGTLAQWSAWHIDGFWIHPDHRRHGHVFRRILTQLQDWMHHDHIQAVIATADAPDMVEYLRRLPTVKLPGEAFAYLRQD